MNRKTRHLMVLLATWGMVWVASAAHGSGQNRAGTTAAPELLIPVGARAMALGGSSVANTAGIEALYWNPAGLTRSPTDATLAFSTMSYLADIRVNYLALAGVFGETGSFAFDIKALDFGDIPITTEAQPDGTGGTFSPTFITVGAHFARELTDRIGLGLTTQYIVNRLDRIQGTAVAFSAGLQYFNLADIDGLDFGVVLKNVGQRMSYDGSALLRRGQIDGVRRQPADYKVEASSADLPSTFEIGLAYAYPQMTAGDLNLHSVFRHNNFAKDQVKFGVEYVYSELLAVRGGFDFATNDDDDTHIYGTSFGFGLQTSIGSLEDVRVDYAYTNVDFFDGLNTFTFEIGF